MSAPLNLIVIVCDTFRRDHLGCYGNPRGLTPNLDRFAAESVLFEQPYACTFPTLPCRVEMFTGRFVFPSVTWGPFPAELKPYSERFYDAHYHTAIISDNLPMMRPHHGYARGFDTKIHIRGQWHDPWMPEGPKVEFPVSRDRLGYNGRVKQYLLNVRSREREEDYFGPQVFGAAMNWLETFGRRSPFLLHIDCFDPHEPWDPPEGDYDPAIVGENRIIFPHLGRASRYSAEELAAIRELYAGEVRMVDRWIGKFLQAIDQLGYRDDTAVLFLSDHGIYLGEHDLLGKVNRDRTAFNGWPPYKEVSETPMLLRVPGLSPRRVANYVHPGDVMPTLMELAGLPIPPEVTAASLLPLARGEDVRPRPVAVTSWSFRSIRPHLPSCIRNHEWSMVWWRTGIQPRLHHLPTDPNEERDVYPQNRDVARELHARYMDIVNREVCPFKNYWPRRFFLSWAPPPHARAEQRA